MEYGGEICGSSPSEAQSRKVVHLRRSRSSSSSQVECARQMYDLDRVSILPVSCCSRETGLLDRYRTIKRGSRLKLKRISWRELKPLHTWHHHLSWFLFGFSPSWVLVLVVIFMTSPSSPKNGFRMETLLRFRVGNIIGPPSR